METALIIGAGPCGLSTAIELKQRGINPIIIEKGCIVNSIFHFPTFMQFFSSSDLLEIGDLPFTIPNDKPTRQEALHYFSRAAKHFDLRIRTYEEVTSVKKISNHFLINTADRKGVHHQIEAKYVIVSTGYYDNPNKIQVPGEDLPKVSHYYKESHPYQGMKVAIIGGKNSAVDAAMDLERIGAEVTMIYRGDEISPSVKPWVRPLFEGLINKDRIQVLWNAHVKEIHPHTLTVNVNGEIQEMDNDYVFALTGYRPNRKLLTSIGVEMNEATGGPVYDEDSMETNEKGVYIAGVIAAGNNGNVIFIENGRFHGGIIAEHIQQEAQRT